METKEIVASLITTAITATSIILLWLLKILIIKTNKKLGDKNNTLEIEKMVDYIIEAETKLGKGQGKAKLLYVLQKLGKKETDKKAIKKINEAHKILETATKEKGE